MNFIILGIFLFAWIALIFIIFVAFIGATIEVFKSAPVDETNIEEIEEELENINE